MEALPSDAPLHMIRPSFEMCWVRGWMMGEGIAVTTSPRGTSGDGREGNAPSTAPCGAHGDEPRNSARGPTALEPQDPPPTAAPGVGVCISRLPSSSRWSLDGVRVDVWTWFRFDFNSVNGNHTLNQRGEGVVAGGSWLYWGLRGAASYAGVGCRVRVAGHLYDDKMA
ncbi:hypothetical protein Tco_0096642 [Tanacetum coccineum]